MLYVEPPNPTAVAVVATLNRALADLRVPRPVAATRSGIPLAALNERLDLNPELLQWDEIHAIAALVGRPASSLIREASVSQSDPAPQLC